MTVHTQHSTLFYWAPSAQQLSESLQQESQGKCREQERESPWLRRSCGSGVGGDVHGPEGVTGEAWSREEEGMARVDYEPERHSLPWGPLC